MCFNIIFRKDGRFPEYEVSQNKEMRKLGIRCMHEEDAALFGKKGMTAVPVSSPRAAKVVHYIKKKRNSL